MKRELFILIIIVLSLLQSCGSGNNDTNIEDKGKDIVLNHARNITIKQLEPGVTLVSLKNPWDTTGIMAKYALIEREKDIPASLPKDYSVIRIPVERSVVYSGVHVSLIEELGAFDAVNGICDVEYIHDKNTLNAVKSGKIFDCGLYSSPNIERILSLKPDVVLLSPYENSDVTTLFKKTDIQLVLTADYMEKTPLGRAEWMRFYGLLYGKSHKADSLFNAIENDYLTQREKVNKVKSRPSVMFDRLYSGVWDVPTSGSVTGILISDAGGSNPFETYNQGGAAHLSVEEILVKAGKSDIWLIRYIEPQLSLDGIGKENPVYKKFKPYQDHNVFGANTLTTNLFEDGAFHPNQTLREMIRLLHPEVETSPLRYYKRLN